MNQEFYWIKVSKKDFPHIAEAFAYAIAYFSNDKVRNTKEENRKRAKYLAEVAGRINGAQIKTTNELLDHSFPQETYS
tara:strand:+ start:43 stop:276 length:234 start_codon:yes stop_codon:yes gene_type:complete